MQDLLSLNSIYFKTRLNCVNSFEISRYDFSYSYGFNTWKKRTLIIKKLDIFYRIKLEKYITGRDADKKWVILSYQWHGYMHKWLGEGSKIYRYGFVRVTSLMEAWVNFEKHRQKKSIYILFIFGCILSSKVKKKKLPA